MDLISLVVVLIVVGLLLWMVNNYIPMEARIKQILNIVGKYSANPYPKITGSAHF